MTAEAGWVAKRLAECGPKPPARAG
jgi:hypothetical protein